MDLSAYIDSPVFSWVVLPILIFLARICDVSIGTIRILLMGKGNKFLIPFLGFVEMLIWIFAVRQIVLNISNVACSLAFAAGFAMGNFIGIVIEEKLAMGVQIIRIIVKQDSQELIKFFQSKGFGVTIVDAQGSQGKVNILFTIVNRSVIHEVITQIKKINPKVFYTIEDVRSVSEGIFPLKSNISSAQRALGK